MGGTYSKAVRLAAFAAASAFILDPQATHAQSSAGPAGLAVGWPGLDPYAFYVFNRDDPRPPEAPLSRQEGGAGSTEKPSRSSAP